MAEATFTFRVDETLKSEFANAAKVHDRTGAQLLCNFMRDTGRQRQEAAEYDARFRRKAQAGLDSANAGHLTPAGDIEARFAAKRAATRRELPASKWRRSIGRPRQIGIATKSTITSTQTTPLPRWLSTNGSQKRR